VIPVQKTIKIIERVERSGKVLEYVYIS
jgi:hypothetical protein